MLRYIKSVLYVVYKYCMFALMIIVPQSTFIYTELLCGICRDECVNPVKLPCHHMFCYLCLKGVTARNNRCALCREAIPIGFLDQSVMLKTDEIKRTLTESNIWFYEAKNGGWWVYERRVAEEIEKAFRDQKAQVHVQISGFLYTVDLVNMFQYREDKPDRKRHIKRGGVNEDCIKGVAGICIENSVNKKVA